MRVVFYFVSSCNCKQKGQSVCEANVGVGLATKHICFYFVLRVLQLYEKEC
nr:hypothetical protein [Campylobacter troglodytis]